MHIRARSSRRRGSGYGLSRKAFSRIYKRRKRKQSIKIFPLEEKNHTSRCSGRKVNLVRLGASNETGDAVLLFICGSVNRGTFVGGSHDEFKFANNSADGGPPPKKKKNKT